MNYNSNASTRTSFGRKVKRVSDVNAMGYTPLEPNFSNQAPYANIGQESQNIPQYPPQDYVSSPMMNQNVDLGPTAPNVMYNMNMPYMDNSQRPNLSAFKQPIVQDFALQYGQQLANVGTNIIQKEVERYVPVGKLKYYFAVDSKYVLKKLILLIFPFTHSNWSIKYEQDTPVQPRFEINAPDLYIPMMAYITYILIAGLLLGTQQRFTFEQIGILSSSALAWFVVELCVYLGTLYISMIQTNLRTLDLLAYSGYKFVGMILSVLISLVAGKTGYYACLVYTNFALAFFLIRALKAQVLSEVSTETSYYGDQSQGVGNKRRLYFLLFVAFTQPILAWWLSYHLIGGGVVKKEL
ncbi:protein YIF1B [Coccinella septempunctata]|uniref:protein YIF1B n=1 Tax=Coccinella septempunctata TaxID=41139 RepID=UPI001D05EA41|nr:protein YIF1B [Coccinella septempunctata]